MKKRERKREGEKVQQSDEVKRAIARNNASKVDVSVPPVASLRKFHVSLAVAWKPSPQLHIQSKKTRRCRSSVSCCFVAFPTVLAFPSLCRALISLALILNFVIASRHVAIFVAVKSRRRRVGVVNYKWHVLLNGKRWNHGGHSRLRDVPLLPPPCPWYFYQKYWQRVRRTRLVE